MIPKRNFAFNYMPLEKQHNARKSDDWIKNQLTIPTTILYVLHENKVVFIQDKLLSFTQNSAYFNQVIEQGCKTVFLGQLNQQSIFMIDVSAISLDTLNNWVGEELTTRSLRHSLLFLPSEQATIMGYASALNHWHNSARYCGYCASKMQSRSGGHSRRCVNSECQKEIFPRTDSAVIMLVEHLPKNGPAKILLAQHHRYSEKVVSTLAGFVDPGESLEQAVEREVMEEVGISVNSVEYQASQPWPFPSSLMLGFFASTNETEINIDDDEIANAYWFTAEQVSGFKSWGEGTDDFQLPPDASISRYLIDTWLAKQK